MKIILEATVQFHTVSPLLFVKYSKQFQSWEGQFKNENQKLLKSSENV